MAIPQDVSPTQVDDTDVPIYKLLESTVTIKVGPSQTQITVHRDLLCQYGLFFKAALEGKFKEANDGEISLPEEPDLYIFRIFVGWVYRLQIIRDSDIAKLLERHDLDSLGGHEEAECAMNAYFSDLIHLYNLGDRYDVPKLRECVLSNLNRALGIYFKDSAWGIFTLSAKNMALIALETRSSSRLYMLVLTLLTRDGFLGDFKGCSLPKKFHVDVQEEHNNTKRHGGFINRPRKSSVVRNRDNDGWDLSPSEGWGSEPDIWGYSRY